MALLLDTSACLPALPYCSVREWNLSRHGLWVPPWRLQCRTPATHPHWHRVRLCPVCTVPPSKVRWKSVRTHYGASTQSPPFPGGIVVDLHAQHDAVTCVEFSYAQ
jgi:hypothetical protein